MRSIRALLLLSLILLTVSQASADTTPSVVRIDPPSITIAQGETGSFDVAIDNADQLNGVDMQVRFDPMVIEVLDADPDADGVQVAVGDMPHPDVEIRNIVDNAGGIIHYAVVQVNSTPPVTGQGVIFSFDVRAKVSGSQSALAIEVVLEDRTGSDQPVQVENGVVIVGSGGAAQPSATPSATASATQAAAAPTATPSRTLSPTSSATATLVTSPPGTPLLTATSVPQSALPSPTADIQLAATPSIQIAPSPTSNVAGAATVRPATPTPRAQPTAPTSPASTPRAPAFQATPGTSPSPAATQQAGNGSLNRSLTASPSPTGRITIAVTPTLEDEIVAAGLTLPSSSNAVPVPLAPLSRNSSPLLGDVVTYGAAALMLLAAAGLLVWLYGYMKNPRFH